jgi:hypothetical protein
MPGTEYICTGRQCDAARTIPERPSEAPRTIRLGCPDCGLLRRHRRTGVPRPPAGAGLPTPL